MEPLIQFNGVSMSYRAKHQRVDLFTGLNLNIQQGELAILLGPSGSGKTTLLNLIAGFVKPTSGAILVNGQNITQYDDFEVCRYRNHYLGYVFQFFNLIYAFNAADNVLVPLLLAGANKSKADQRVTELLEQVGMTHRRKHYPGELSGGEQQRIAIARALANSPEIILADEPTGNLDKKNGEIVLDLLHKINLSGKTVILSTHDHRLVSKASAVYDMTTLLNQDV